MIKDVKTDSYCTYNELLVKCATEDFYYPVFRYQSTVDFITNFIKALSSNEPITLVDSDFTNSEIENYGLLNQLNIPKSRSISKCVSFEELISQIQLSTSEITLFTSGTTGVPKKVSHSVSSLNRLTRISNSYRNNNWALAYNPTHMAGIQVIFQAILNQNNLTNVFGCSTEVILNALLDNSITHISATPTFYRLITGANKIFPTVTRVTLGGEKSDNNLHHAIKSVFPNAKLNNVYATTEFGSILVSKGDLFSIPIEMESLVKVEDNELWVKSDLLASSNNEEWYKTGDQLEIINKSPLQFKFVGRKSDMINVGGNKVNPNEIEEILREFVEVRNAVVFGKANSVLGNILCANVVLNSEYTIDKKIIIDRLKIKLQEFKIPRIINFVDDINTTRTGKLSR